MRNTDLQRDNSLLNRQRIESLTFREPTVTSLATGFVIYLGVLVVVAVITSKRNRTLPDFLLAGRKLGPWVVAFSERASGESGWLLLGLTGLAYASGLGDPAGTALEPPVWT
ncbi:MAG: hypothetical protein AAEJ47_03795, partial [Planctomycetota bacterium]